MNAGRARQSSTSRSAAPGVIRFHPPAIAEIILVIVNLLIVLLTIGCRPKAAGRPPLPYLAFVANQLGRNVAVVDLAQFKVLAEVAVAPEPQRVVARPQSKEVYAVSSSGWLSVIVSPELRVTKTLRVGRSASHLVFSPDGRQAYLLEPDAGQIVFVDCGQIREIARLRPGGKLSSLALSPDGKTLVAADSDSHLIYFIRTDERKVLGSVEVGQSPGPMGILPDGSKIFVADTGENKITAVEVASRRILSNLELGASPTSLMVKPDGGEIFVLSSANSTLTILDAFHDNVEQTLTTGRDPVAGVLSRDANLLYIASAADGNIIAMDAPNRQVLPSGGVTHVGVTPSALALTPDERYLVVADVGTSSVAILRTDRNTLVTTIPVGNTPVDLVIPDWLRK